MYYTWLELEALADNLRTIRDQYLQYIPLNVFVILYRDLKLIEQEIRILTEIDNFLQRTYGQDTPAYYSHHAELLEIKIQVKLRELTIDAFNNIEMTPALFNYLIPFIKEDNDASN